MYFVSDDTSRCGYYECKKCGYRFLSEEVADLVACPDCDSEIDYEIGPDEVMGESEKSAVLLEVCEGKEKVEMMDALLSLAITGGNFEWI